jgi:RNA polymerase sigma-70 factor, ECF subfamily
MLTTDELANLVIGEQRNLIAFLTMLTGDRFAADDLFQETFLELTRLRCKFKPGTNFAAWARSVARFQALRYMRTRQKDHINFTPELISRLAETWDEMAYSPEHDNRESALKYCMEELQYHHRNVLKWRYKERRSHKYIAEQLERSADAVKMLVSRLHKKLRYCVESRLINPDAGLTGGNENEK